MLLKNIEVKTFPCNKDKSPKTRNGFLDATFDNLPDEVYGVCCGEAKNNMGDKTYLLVIDVDVKNNGVSNWGVISKKFSDEDLDTFSVKTQSGGYHYYYTVDLPFAIKKTLANGIDLKFVGGYVIGAGSVGEKGSYDIINDSNIRPLSEDMFMFFQDQFNNNKNQDDIQDLNIDISDDEKELVIEKLSDNRDWDVNYNTRLGVLKAMKKTGFDFGDFKSIIRGSNTDKTTEDWRKSWESHDGEVSIIDYKVLMKYSKHYFENLKVEINSDNIEDYPYYTTVSSVDEAYKLSERMFGGRFSKIQINPETYVLDKRVGEVMKINSFCNAYNGWHIDCPEFKSPKEATYFFLQRAKLYYGFIFKPNSNERDYIDEEDGLMKYNLWEGLKTKVEENPLKSMFPKMSYYIEEVLAKGRKEVYDLLYTYIAKVALNPTDRVNTFALVAHSSGEGTGKSIFGDIIINIIGEKFSEKIESVDSLANENNALKNKLFVYIDESANEFSKHAKDLLKTYITDKKFRLKQKYVSGYTLDNYAHFFFTSNDTNVAPLSMSDRRYLVIKPDTSKQQDKVFFGELHKEINNKKALEHLLGFVAQYKDAVVELPETEERIEQQRLNASPELKWLLSMAEEESLEWNIYNSKEYQEVDGQGRISSLKSLYNMYRSFIDETYQNLKIKNMFNFNSELVNLGFLDKNRKSVVGGGKYYSILTKEELINKYRKYINEDNIVDKNIQI